MPLASADETPSRSIKLRPRPAIQQVSAEEEVGTSQKAATERWKELKAKQSEFDASATVIPQTKTASRPQSTGLIRPFPSDDTLDHEEDSPAVDEWLEAEEAEESTLSVEPPSTLKTETTSDEPLPITGFDQPPDWILGANPELVEDLSEDMPADEAPPKRLAARKLLEDFVEKPAPQESPDTPAPLEPEDTKTPSGTDPGYTPMPSGNRRPRQITSISPRYDTEIDRDIREFAKQQARQYGLEFGKGVYEPRAFYGMAYQWEPSNFYHYPLYFEDPQLERYGHTYGPVAQPIASIARFGGQLLLLPYQMTLDPICCPKYALGWYRPGDCAPYLHYQVPLNAQAAAVEAGVITGLFFLIP